VIVRLCRQPNVVAAEKRSGKSQSPLSKSDFSSNGEQPCCGNSFRWVALNDPDLRLRKPSLRPGKLREISGSFNRKFVFWSSSANDSIWSPWRWPKLCVIVWASPRRKSNRNCPRSTCVMVNWTGRFVRLPCRVRSVNEQTLPIGSSVCTVEPPWRRFRFSFNPQMDCRSQRGPTWSPEAANSSRHMISGGGGPQFCWSHPTPDSMPRSEETTLR